MKKHLNPTPSPWIGHQHYGHSGAAKQLTWCHPCGQRCGAQAGGLYLLCHAPAAERPPDYDPAAKQWPEE